MCKYINDLATCPSVVRRLIRGMFPCLVFAVAAGLCMQASALDKPEASVYLIAAEPAVYSNERIDGARPAVLYRLEGNALRKVRTIATWRQATQNVQIFHDLGLGVVVSSGMDSQSFVLDFLQASDMSKERSVDLHLECNGICVFSTSGLLRQDNRLMYVIKATSKACAGVYLDTLEPADEVDCSVYITDLYRFGLPRYRVPNNVGLLRQVDGRLVLPYDGTAKMLSVDWSFPSVALREYLPQVGWVVIETDYARLISRQTRAPRSRLERAGRDQTWLVFDKRANRWNAISIFGRVFWMQAFRRWVVFGERYWNRRNTFDLEPNATQHSEGFQSAAEQFQLHRYPPTGRFFFYDVPTASLHSIETKKLNAEILYVDDQGRSYLRVSDELWCAPVMEGDLGRTTVLAKQSELWAVHWLMMGMP